MKYGFKAKAEKTSLRLRKELGLAPSHSLPARELALHLSVIVLTVEDIPGLDPNHASALTGSCKSGWSAFTLVAEGRHFIVHNVTHAPTRQESDIMHELGHILCKHPAGDTLWIGPFCLKHFDPEQEDEATWLGGVLQAPRQALLQMYRKTTDRAQLARHFGASKQMVTYRLNTEGVAIQVQRERLR